MAKNLSVIIPTAEQGEVSVSQYHDDIYVNFYHEALILTAEEAKTLMAALGAAVFIVSEES